jgi:RimJ/RimL family protein N-acetyltransferase
MAWNDEPQPTLTTERLVLRPFRPADGPTVDELAGDRRVADTTGAIPHPYPKGGSLDWIATHAGHWSNGRGAEYAVTLRGANDLPIGAVGLSIDRANRSASLGYWIGVPYWGRGYGTEAARAVVDLAFELVGLNRVAATYLTRNPASGRIMEKLGMSLEGVSRQAIVKWDVAEDLAQRAILRSEWEARRRNA